MDDPLTRDIVLPNFMSTIYKDCIQKNQMCRKGVIFFLRVLIAKPKKM